MKYIQPYNAISNKGVLCGSITKDEIKSFKVEDEVFYEGKIAIKRLSKYSDILPFVVSEKIINQNKESLSAGRRVKLNGEIRSYNRIEDGKNRLIVSFFVKELTFDVEKDENNTFLTGYICKQPVYRVTPSACQICDVLLAVHRQDLKKSDYIPCILWARDAVFMKNQKIGTLVTFEGRFQSRPYKKEINGEVKDFTAYEFSVNKSTVTNINNSVSKLKA